MSTGDISEPHHLPQWDGKNLSKDLTDIFGCLSKTANDAVAAGIAEFTYSSHHKASPFSLVIIGTGIGAVRILPTEDTVLVFPTEFGHVVVEYDGQLCPCGQKGCVEAYASGYGIKQLYSQTAETIIEPDVWRKTAQYISQALVSLLLFHPTNAIYFSGGLISNQPALLDLIDKELQKQLVWITKPTLEISQFGSDAGLYGALAILGDTYKFSFIKN